MKQLLMLLTFFISLNLFSQSNSGSSSSNQSRVRVYDSYVPSKEEENPILRNYVGINPLGLMIGDFPLYYERNLVGPLNIMFGAGVTKRNYLYDFFPQDVLNSGGVSMYDSDFKRTAQLGYSFMVQPKIYLNQRDFHGMYLGVEYRFRKYNYTSSEYNNTALTSDVKEYRTVSDIKFNIGWAFNLGSNIVLDYYIGIGTRTNGYRYATYNSHTGSAFISPYDISYTNQNKGTITVGTGFRVGYAF